MFAGRPKNRRGRLGAHLGPPWGHLGANWGPTWGQLGAPLGPTTSRKSKICFFSEKLSSGGRKLSFQRKCKTPPDLPHLSRSQLASGGLKRTFWGAQLGPTTSRKPEIRFFPSKIIFRRPEAVLSAKIQKPL